MKFCQPHWDALRSAIDARGLSALVAEGGEAAARNLAGEVTDGPSIDNYDPLMSAHFAIWNNAMSLSKDRYQANPLAMMAADPEHPEWECPICFLNWLHAEHDAHCTQEGCNYPKGETYEWMIDRAADEQVEAWREMKP